MVLRRALLPALALLLFMGSVATASAAPRRDHHRALRHQLALLHAQAHVERFAITDVDNDGDLDILIAPRDGGLVLWRNAGHGRFHQATTTPQRRYLPWRGARVAHLVTHDDTCQCGVERYDAAMPRAPAAAAVLSVSLVRAVSTHSLRPVSERRSSGRAPPLA